MIDPIRTKAWFVVLAPILLLCIIILTPLAYATPPDLSWIPGVSDAADHDDVVTLITSALDALQPIAPIDLESNQRTTSLARPLSGNSVAVFVPSSQPRAPPYR